MSEARDLLRRPLTELTGLLASKSLSPVELMEATLRRIEDTRDTLNTMCGMRERDALLADAREAEARIGRGEGRVLEGIPLGVKELEDAEGLPSTHASLPFKDRIAAQDSVQVERLEAAGAIVVGKTNAPEFGYTALTKNLIYGLTRSPWNLDHTPGGSSGGTSAAIAGAVLPLGTASDGGGSVRLPASFTGCFGLKVSYGRIPHGPDALWIWDDTAVHGPLTRTVEDAALHMDAVVGPHPADPCSLPHPGLSYREVLDRCPPGLRIGFSADLGYAAVQSDVAEVVGDAVQAFEQLGHHVELMQGGPPHLGRDWAIVGSFALAARLGDLVREREKDFGRAFIAGVKTAAAMTPEKFGKAMARREELNQWCADTFERYDLVVTPTTPCDPPPAKGPFQDEVEGKRAPIANVAAFTIPFNLSWHPAATVRAGLSRAGLPVGMQIVGPRHRDDLVLQAARAFEQARPWADVWPNA